MKKSWQSKTIWVNLLLAISGAVAVWVPAVSEWMSEANIIMIFGFVNMILRATTKDRLEFS